MKLGIVLSVAALLRGLLLVRVPTRTVVLAMAPATGFIRLREEVKVAMLQ